MKNSKERNSVDLFSDYGLDERQKALASDIGFSSFKALFNLVIVITVLWVSVYCAEPQINIHFRFVLLSYLAAAAVVRCAYAVKTAKLGIINGITAFSYTTGSIVRMIVFAAAAAALIILDSKLPIDGIFLAMMLITAAVEEAVLYCCGKKNFAVIDSDTDEESEE